MDIESLYGGIYEYMEVKILYIYTKRPSVCVIPLCTIFSLIIFIVDEVNLKRTSNLVFNERLSLQNAYFRNLLHFDINWAKGNSRKTMSSVLILHKSSSCNGKEV